MPIICKCQYCNKEFKKSPSDIKGGRGIYCSRRCGALGKIKTIPISRELQTLKDRARWKLKEALKSGKITKMACQVCNEPKSEGHHKDYSFPLGIEWLCRKHHREADYRDGTKMGDFGH